MTRRIHRLFCLAVCITLLTACAAPSRRPPIEYTAAPGESANVIIVYSTWPIIKTLSELGEKTKLIVRVTNITEVDSHYISVFYGQDAGEGILTEYTAEVAEGIKGDVKRGDVVRFWVRGGKKDDRIYLSEFYERLADEFEYILFLKEISIPGRGDALFPTDVQNSCIPLKNGFVSFSTKDQNRFVHDSERATTLIERIKAQT